ncbi:hypothetical protein D9758_017113 [Tetrapyrgos nigripes]|uniref:Transketolase-like pyrimidine-binding domain-containing protein n=1 Tax=Tetrapyrgos nigripes TaxID=182062 RepID=A0A8H5FN96_9AGAR|nr:hypothetical protein D9758_017113 [Tetrapyrgos nigripes]
MYIYIYTREPTGFALDPYAPSLPLTHEGGDGNRRVWGRVRIFSPWDPRAVPYLRLPTVETSATTTTTTATDTTNPTSITTRPFTRLTDFQLLFKQTPIPAQLLMFIAPGVERIEVHSISEYDPLDRTGRWDLEVNRVVFGEAVNRASDKLSKEKAKAKVMVIDSDLEGSTGLKSIHQKHPEVFVTSGIMERGNFSAAAGFDVDKDKFGVFSTFSAFLEMVLSEITMARLNNCNVLCHFSHAGVDEMANNTCHFGINNMFADNGLSDIESFLYFPADTAQMTAVIDRIFFERGLRFVFSTRCQGCCYTR